MVAPSVIAALMTVGVYGIVVAAIVKLDDLGLHLSQSRVRAQRLAAMIGRGILRAALAG
ncbi:MAG: DUF808 family protein [Burkholderiaceae bacterium]